MRIAAPVLAILASGCVSTVETTTRMQSQWVGQPADAFFVSHGPPAVKHDLDAGGALYLWSSGVEHHVIPGNSYSSGRVTWDGRVQVNTINSPATSIDTECQARITVDSAGIIQRIEVQKDTIGEWALSRCRESLGL